MTAAFLSSFFGAIPKNLGLELITAELSDLALDTDELLAFIALFIGENIVVVEIVEVADATRKGQLVATVLMTSLAGAGRHNQGTAKVDRFLFNFDQLRKYL